MEIGLYTFADVAPGAAAGQRLKNLIEEMELADQVGLDIFGVGEHHRPIMRSHLRPSLLLRVRRAPGGSGSPALSRC